MNRITNYEPPVAEEGLVKVRRDVVGHVLELQRVQPFPAHRPERGARPGSSSYRARVGVPGGGSWAYGGNALEDDVEHPVDTALECL
jgi:hypothetical protein